MIETEKLVLSVPEVAALLGVCRAHAYTLARTGQLPIIRLGRRLVVPKVALERMLSEVKPTCVGDYGSRKYGTKE
jgi:excisionase family DNA binding protein